MASLFILVLCVAVTLCAATGSVISLLVSSEFLQMEQLMNECVMYFREHFRSVIRVPLDISCISDAIVARLSDVTPDRLLLGFKVCNCVLFHVNALGLMSVRAVSGLEGQAIPPPVQVASAVPPAARQLEDVLLQALQ